MCSICGGGGQFSPISWIATHMEEIHMGAIENLGYIEFGRCNILLIVTGSHNIRHKLCTLLGTEGTEVAERMSNSKETYRYSLGLPMGKWPSLLIFCLL